MADGLYESCIAHAEFRTRRTPFEGLCRSCFADVLPLAGFMGVLHCECSIYGMHYFSRGYQSPAWVMQSLAHDLTRLGLHGVLGW
jgi:hypothetical protein